MESNNKNSQIAIAIMAGIAAGAATWYFITTENGKHNWRTFLEIAKDISDKLGDMSMDTGSNLSSAGRNISNYVDDRAQEVMS